MDKETFLSSAIGFDIGTWATFSVVSAFSAGRYGVQLQRHGRFLLEDWVHLAALVQCFVNVVTNSLWVWNVFQIWASKPPYTDHIWIVRWDLDAIQLATYWSTVYTGKAVFLIAYRRVFGVSRGFLYFWWALVILCIVAFLMGFLAQFFLCAGNPQDWSFTSPQCMNEGAYSRSYNNMSIMTIVTNAGSDILLLILALVMVFRIRTSWNKKLRMAPVFLLALGTIAVDLTAQSFVLNGWTNYFISQFLFGLEAQVVVFISALPPILSWFRRSRADEGDQPVMGPAKRMQSESVGSSAGGLFTASSSEGQPTIRNGLEIEIIEDQVCAKRG